MLKQKQHTYYIRRIKCLIYNVFQTRNLYKKSSSNVLKEISALKVIILKNDV